jgi:hypothetical protein
MYILSYGNLRTGDIYGTLNVTACTVSDELRKTGTFHAHVPISHAAETWAKLNHGPVDMWLLEWEEDFGRSALAGGPILAQAFDSNGVDLSGAGLWWVFGARILLHNSWTPSIAGPPVKAAKPPWSIINFDFGTIMMMLCREVTDSVGDTTPYAKLPIVWEDERSAGSSTVRTYQPYDLVTVMQRVEELGNIERNTDGRGGPDWALLPAAYDSTRPATVSWQFLTGTEAQPMLFGDDAPLVLDATAPRQDMIRNLTGVRDGSSKVTRAFSSGGGTEGSKVIKVKEQSDRVNGIRVDSVYSNDATVQATVQGYADAALTKHSKTPSALTVDVEASYWWRSGGRVGMPVELRWAGHPILGDIVIITRAIAWGASIDSRWVKLTLADTTVEI